jgi:hypothetical protein
MIFSRLTIYLFLNKGWDQGIFILFFYFFPEISAVGNIGCV